MPDKLNRRQVRSLKKTFEHKERRLELKARQSERQAERAARLRRPPRESDWWDDEQDFDPVGSVARRGGAQAFAAEPRPAPDPPPETVGTVIEVRSGDSLVMLQGRIARALLPPGLRLTGLDARSPLAVGDRVQLELVRVGEGRIVAVLPRRSALLRDVYDQSRRDAVARGQVIAANIDQVAIVCSPQAPPFRPRLLDRYLVAASRDGIEAVVCLNKVDLGVPDDVARDLRGYRSLAVRTVETSAVAGSGLDELRAAVSGKVTLFAGHSGVGKSSLLNAVEPGLVLRVGEVTQTTAGQGKGRHTTSSARLVPLSLPESFVVDSPGIRAFSVRGVAPGELAPLFPGIAGLGGCAFRDCLHRDEAGCAVLVRAEGDAFLRERLASYRALLAELTE